MIKHKLLVIVGPTASGKSDLAVKLAKKFNGELISADSRQIYKEMNIATAKLKPPKAVNQWLVSVARPDQIYTLAEYQRDALKIISDIHKRGKLPILVGGTGLYIDAVSENWQIPRVSPNKRLRSVLEREFKAKGLSAIVKHLKKVDPKSAHKIDLKNPRRVLRALEVALATGESFVTAKKKGAPLFDVLKIGIAIDKQKLNKRLLARTEKMISQGLIAETKKLLKKYNANLPAMSGIGYAEVTVYINKIITREEMVKRIVTRSYQYAHRQMTWWKRDKKIVWSNKQTQINAVVSRWLKNK